MNRTRVSLVVFLTLLFSINCHATWSIIAVDRTTGQIGIAGASCTFDVSGIASIVPGKGAVVVQAASSYFARMKGVELMNKDATLEEIILALRDDQFQPENQQYGLILLESGTKPIVYSGAQIKDWNGGKLGGDFAVMGNILPRKQVIEKAYEAFESNREKSLGERLMLALKAGEEAGGDKRCGEQYARSAFVMVYTPEHEAILKLAVQGMPEGGKPAVTLLSEQFDSWYTAAR